MWQIINVWDKSVFINIFHFETILPTVAIKLNWIGICKEKCNFSRTISGKCIDSNCPTFASCFENTCLCNPGFVNISGECEGTKFLIEENNCEHIKWLSSDNYLVSFLFNLILKQFQIQLSICKLFCLINFNFSFKLIFISGLHFRKM